MLLLEIKILLGKRYGIRDIARATGRSPSSISKEIKINSVNGEYDPSKANQKSCARNKYARYQGKKIVQNIGLRKKVDSMLLEGYSPRMISGWLAEAQNKLPNVSDESIRRYLKSPYGKLLKIPKRKKRRKRGRKRMSLDGRKFIEKRPLAASFGDMEADFIVSGKQGKGILLVMMERTTRYLFVKKINKGNMRNVHSAFLGIKERFPCMGNITTDNDILFVRHKELEALMGADIFFCNPHHPWEKGAIENRNREIRKYIPKGSDMSKVSPRKIRNIEEALNNRIMACLRYRSPREKLEKETEKRR